MPIIKYARAEIVEVFPKQLNTDSVRIALGSKRVAHLDPVLLDPSKFIYTRERAISAFERHGLNGNYDGWVEPILKESYHTFQHVPRYIDHDNMNPDRAVGIVLDAWYHPLDEHPQGGWVETISARDRDKMASVKLPHFGGMSLLEAVESKRVTDVSMGCFVDESVCTVCGNLAHDIIDYCDHVLNHKGSRLRISSRSPLIQLGYNEGDEVIVGELNYGVTFFELSDITTQAQLGGGGADLEAKILERVAMKSSPGGWEDLLTVRMPAVQSPEQVRGIQVAHAENAHFIAGNTVDNEVNQMPRKKRAQEGSDPVDNQRLIPKDENVAQEVQPADYPAPSKTDKDQALFDQSQPRSEGIDPQIQVDDPDNLSQETEPDDYPHQDKAGGKKKGDFIPSNADPANTLGETPPQVADEEDAMREEKFEDVEPLLDPEEASEAEDEMYEEMDEEEHMDRMGAALNLLPKAARGSERVAQKEDTFDTLVGQLKMSKSKAKSVKSKAAKQNWINKASEADVKIRGLIRDVLAYGTEPEAKGNQQQLIDAEGYEQGDPDANLLDQSQDQSAPSGEQHLIDSAEDVAQAERPDRPHQGDGKAAAKVILADNADAAADEMARRLAQGEDFETVNAEVFEQFGVSPQSNRASRKTAEEIGKGDEYAKAETDPADSQKASDDSEMGKGTEYTNTDQYEDGVQAKRKRAQPEPPELPEDPSAIEIEVEQEQEKEARRRKKCAEDEEEDTAEDEVDPLTLKGKKRRTAESADEELDDSAGESKTDLSGDVKEDASNDDLVGRGTTKTLMSPETERVVDQGSELIQMSNHRQKLLARFRRHAQGEDPEARLDQGTTNTKASPSTQEIADGENMFQMDELNVETQGQSATPQPAILSGQQLLAIANLRVKAALRKKTAECLRLRESNERYYKRYAETAKAWKWDQCARLAMEMIDKGQFAFDEKTQKQRGVKEQRHAAYAEAREMMTQPNEEIERLARVVSRIKSQPVQPPRWKKEIKRPHPDAIKRAHTVPQGQHRQQEDLGDNLFVEDTRRGF